MMTNAELLAVNSNLRPRHGDFTADRRTSPWIAAAMVVLAGCAVPAEDTTRVATSAEASLLCNPAILPGTEIAPGVTYYDCTAPRLLFDVRAHIVTIDRSLPATEIRLLTDPASNATKADRDKPL